MICVCILALLALASATPISEDLSPFPRDVNIIPADASDFRLPTSIVPISYDIKLVPFITVGNFTFKGEVVIVFRVDEATNSIVLHANKLDIDASSISVINTNDNAVVPVVSGSWDAPTHFYTVLLGEELELGGQYQISISRFTGILDNDDAGFYRSSYFVGLQRRWLATTQFESTEARRAFPCFDEPALKAQFTLSISRTEDLRAIANMPQLGEPELDTENTDEVRYWDHFETTPLMSTYLLAFIVSDFPYLEDVAEKLRIFVQPDLVHQAEYSLSVSPPLLNWMADYTTIPYHLPKMDEAAIPDFAAGAMENWGLVTYRKSLLLFEEGVNTIARKQSIATVIAHEYAHQWFGDLVSPAWWKYLWLNEGFATYFEYFATAQVETSWGLEDLFVLDVVQRTLRGNDAKQNSHPMTVDVASPASIDAIFDGISYQKSGAVIRMLEHILTPGVFQRGLTRYLLARSYKDAVPDDLFAALNDQLHEEVPDTEIDVKRVMDTWTLQMGYPVLNVSRNYAENTAVLTQQRFLITVIPNHPDTRDYRWNIPLTYTTRDVLEFDNLSPKDWFYVEEASKEIGGLPDETQWVLFNLAQSSYYRVNYDEDNWALLNAHLNSDDFEEINALSRAQIVDDAFYLAQAGMVKVGLPLSLSKYLKRERHFTPWMAAFNTFTDIESRLSNIKDYSKFQGFLLELVQELYTAVGFEENSSDDHTMKLKRAAAVKWACYLRHEDCIAKSQTSFEAWMATPDVNPINTELRSTVYCTAVMSGSKTEWDFLLSQFVNNEGGSESSMILSALGCSEDADTLKNYMLMAVTESSPIRREYLSTVFSSVYNNAAGVEIALDFVITEFKKLSEHNGGMKLVETVLQDIANRCNTQDQANKMTSFLAANSEALGSAAASVKTAIQSIEDNVKWQKTTGQDMIDWIKYNHITK